jgi:type IV pilus assembly protein PilC
MVYMADATQSFRWTGIDKSGKRVSGDIKASDSYDAQNELRKRDVEVVSLEQRRASRIFTARSKKITPETILIFTRYLSTLLAAGMPIMQSLEILGRDQDNAAMHDFVIALKSNISEGKTLGESFSQYPQYFSPLYCNLIKIGEKSGMLEKILIRLADYIEKTENLKRKVRKAMIYPAAIITVATIVSLILLFFVVPKFQDIFKSFGGQLPYFTRLVISFSHFLRSYWWLILAGIAAAIFGFRHLHRTNIQFREKIDDLILRVLIIGPILRKSIIARYTRTFAITLESGMPIVDAMKSMADIMGNSVYSKAILQICYEVTNGNQLYVAMEATKLFPNMAVQMISVGEASGSLSAMLNKVADHYEADVNNIVDNLSSLLEPLIMAVLGVIIGGFVIAMYLPIFKLGGLF